MTTSPTELDRVLALLATAGEVGMLMHAHGASLEMFVSLIERGLAS